MQDTHLKPFLGICCNLIFGAPRSSLTFHTDSAYKFQKHTVRFILIENSLFSRCTSRISKAIESHFHSTVLLLLLLSSSKLWLWKSLDSKSIISHVQQKIAYKKCSSMQHKKSQKYFLINYQSQQIMPTLVS